MKKVLMVVGILFLIAVVRTWATPSVTVPSPVASRSAEPSVADRQLTIMLNLARWVKKGMNDPSSFEVVEAGYTADGVSLKYRGKNAFNAFIINQVVVCGDDTRGMGTPTSRDVIKAWNRCIAGSKRSWVDQTSSMLGAKLLGAY